MNNEITEQEVLKVCERINKPLTQNEIEWVIENYDNPNGENNPDLMIEMLVRGVPKKTFSYHLDQKVTTWMRTHFEIEALNRADANERAVNFINSDEIETLTWDELADVKEVMSVEDNGGASTKELYTSIGELVYHNEKED
jgi:hypothetical protein